MVWVYHSKSLVSVYSWYYGKNYDAMEKTMVLYGKLWNFDLLWKKYGTMVKTMVLK